jgi:hypothetical protein
VNKHENDKQFIARCVAAALILGPAAASSTGIDSWNRDNAVTDLPHWPPGVEPSHVPGVTYDSILFTDTSKLESNGAVIWKEGAVIAPGADVLTGSPGPGDNCIITSGTNRAVPGSIPKTCTDEFQSAKRVKLEARKPSTIAPDGNLDGKPLDMVFDVSDADGVARTYRVFKKYINATGQRMDGFIVQLGFGTGDAFIPSTTGDGLKFTPRKRGQSPTIQDFHPLPFYSEPPGDSDLGSLMSAGLFGDAADNQNRTIDGYFGLPDNVAPWTDPTCEPDPSGTGRSYYNLVVRTEDSIETLGDVQGLHFCLFGNMLPQGQLPLGYFWDPDGDPVTDADTIADWDGSGESPACGGTPCWQTYVVLDVDPASPTYGDPVLDANGNFTRPANPPVAVPQHVIDFWVANPEPVVYDPANPIQFYFITELDDMGLVNNNYHITVESIEQWPTYNTTSATATFTMRTSNVGEGAAFTAPWLASLPPELAPPPAPSDVAISLDVAATVDARSEVPLGVTLSTAAGQPAASGHLSGQAIDPATDKVVASLYGEFTDLAAGASQAFTFNWLVDDPTGLPAQVIWSVTASVDGGDPNPADNTAEALVLINGGAIAVDLDIGYLYIDDRVRVDETSRMKIYLTNHGPDIASGEVRVIGTDSRGRTVATFSEAFSNLAADDWDRVSFIWTAPSKATTIEWLVSVSAEGDSDLSNNTATASTTVVKESRRKRRDD